MTAGRSWIPVLVMALTACTTKEAAPVADSAAPAATPAAESDPDKNVSGGALPAGYTARTDKTSASISDAKYAVSGGDWDVTTGPAHIIYSAKDLGSGSYTASTTVEQLEAPSHPEAYGIVIGGSNLDNDSQTYTYFLVRGTGDLAIKVREGGNTRDVVKWTPSAEVPKADASGKARYDLAVQVTGDAVKFMVNGRQAASVSKAGLPTDGIAGVRINHNLHVKVRPISISTP
jgi:hypothetical protein